MDDRVLDALRAAIGRPDDTAVRRVEHPHPDLPARYRAAPTSTEEAAAVLRVAATYDLAVVATGAGTKQDWAMPPRRCDLIVDTRRLDGVVEHAAGDLIVVVRAGTRLAELQAKLAPAGQHLALDEPLPAGTVAVNTGATTAGTVNTGARTGGTVAVNTGGTVGGTVAVNTSGPRRMLYGTARDLLIGITVVRPDGVVARAGGKVVKNVAGYDLGKLFTGSYGTLGLITECAFRLHPLPAARAYVRRPVEDAADAGRLVAAVLGAQVVPSALEVDAPETGGLDVAVLLEGVPGGVERRAAATARLFGGDATVSEVAPPWWSAYPWRAGEVGLKLTAALSGVPALLAAARRAGRRHDVPIAVRGSAGTGVLYAGLPGTASPDAVAAVVDGLRTAAADAGGHAVVLTAPAAVRERVDLWGPVAGLDLMRRVKQRFDPQARFAPGRFVGGI